MLKVKVVKKYHDAKGILIGYSIQDEAGNKMDVYKDQLKNAVASGQCEVINMTLTSDGRFIGKASGKDTKQRTISKVTHKDKLVKVCTNGRNVVAAIIDTINPEQSASEIKTLQGLKPGRAVHVGHIAMKKAFNGEYGNIEVIDGKPNLSNVKRGSFSTVKARLLNVLRSEYKDISDITFTVAKYNDKYGYIIKIDNINDIRNSTDKSEDLQNIIFALIEDACATAKIKVIGINEDGMEVKCLTGINDVRKALKLIKTLK